MLKVDWSISGSRTSVPVCCSPTRYRCGVNVKKRKNGFVMIELVKAVTVVGDSEASRVPVAAV